jgi:hypothetical protein
VVVDAPLPGTAVLDEIRSNPRLSHFASHGTRDTPELLVAGRERNSSGLFSMSRVFDPSAIDGESFEACGAVYSAPGAMRAGFELYRAFDRDIQDDRRSHAQRQVVGFRFLPYAAPSATRGRAWRR